MGMIRNQPATLKRDYLKFVMSIIQILEKFYKLYYYAKFIAFCT